MGLHPLFVKLFHLVNKNLQMLFAPCIGGGTHFVTQVIEKLSGVRQLFPDLWKEGGAARTVSQHYTVYAWV